MFIERQHYLALGPRSRGVEVICTGLPDPHWFPAARHALDRLACNLLQGEGSVLPTIVGSLVLSIMDREL